VLCMRSPHFLRGIGGWLGLAADESRIGGNIV
jgi:hypothetical protein